jgi:tyrosinase
MGLLDVASFMIINLVCLAFGDAVSELEKDGRIQLNTLLAKSSTCTTPSIRREWGDISREARLQWIDAVKCLTKSPSKLNQEEYPGAKTRYDDFVAVHINQTLHIHGTVCPTHNP